MVFSVESESLIGASLKAALSIKLGVCKVKLGKLNWKYDREKQLVKSSRAYVLCSSLI